MDLSSITGVNTSTQENNPAVTYSAQAASPAVNGEVKMRIGDKALTVTALFDTVELAFAEINALTFSDYIVTVKADSGSYAFSRMGEWGERFYDAICSAYSNAVLRSMFIKGSPLLTAKGNYCFFEKDSSYNGTAPVYVYDNCVVTLPPDLSARRVPLCFVSSLDKGDFELTLQLDTDERYSFAKLGYDTDVFADKIESQIRLLREETLTAAKDIDPSLTAEQAARLAKLMPQGTSAPINQLTSIAPSFLSALEARIATTSDAEYYTAAKELCDPSRIWIGFRKNETASLDRYLIWFIVSSPNSRYAAIEFTEAGSATFVYRTGGSFDRFARQINRALEAISFKREVIRLSDEELRKPENADYYMASKRTSALQFVRAHFAGRIIHTSVDSWKSKLIETWS